MLHLVDFADPKFWADGAKVVIAAPQIVFPLFGIVAFATWWLAKGRYKDRYQGTIDGLRKRVAALEERLRLAQDSERTVARKSTELETQLTTLRSQITVGASKEVIMGTTTTISSTAAEIRVANTETGRILTTIPPSA